MNAGERDQQKWKPVLRPVALQILDAHGSYRQTAHASADHARRHRLYWGAGHRLFGNCLFRNRWELAMLALRLNDLRQHSDTLQLRTGKSLTVRFVEPHDAEALQGYFRALTVRSRYNR